MQELTMNEIEQVNGGWSYSGLGQSVAGGAIAGALYGSVGGFGGIAGGAFAGGVIGGIGYLGSQLFTIDLR